MQGLADGYFILPYTIGVYLAQAKLATVGADHRAFRQVERDASERVERLLAAMGRHSTDALHRGLGARVGAK